MSVGRLWNPGMMSSIRQDWATPYQLFAMLEREFTFVLDACADHSNALCREYFWEQSLDQSWVRNGAVWCNPPYGRKIGDWVHKALRESECGATVVMLLPARTDTAWFHDYCMKGEIRFLRNRLYFTADKKSRAPFPSMIVIFRAVQSG